MSPIATSSLLDVVASPSRSPAPSDHPTAPVKVGWSAALASSCLGPVVAGLTSVSRCVVFVPSSDARMNGAIPGRRADANSTLPRAAVGELLVVQTISAPVVGDVRSTGRLLRKFGLPNTT